MAIDRIPNDFCRGHWCNYAGIGPFDYCGHAGSFDARDVKYFDPRTGDRLCREKPYDARAVLWSDSAVFIQKNLANSTFKSGSFTASYHSVSQGPDSRIHYLSIGLSVLCGMLNASGSSFACNDRPVRCSALFTGHTL